MTGKEEAQTLIDAMLDRIRQISERSDVQYKQMVTHKYNMKRWRGRMPEDFRLFYQRLGGLAFEWGFRDEDDYQHGPRFHALGPDGKSVYERVQGDEFLATEARMPAKKFEWLGPEVQGWGNDPVVIFSGRSGESGLLQRERADGTFGYYHFNHSDITHLADSFSELLSKALASGFASGWEEGSGPAPAALDRLQTPVALRELVEIELVRRAEFSNEDHRAELAAAVDPAGFDRLMVALARDERSEGLDGEARMKILLDAFAGAGKWSAATCKVAAPLVRSFDKSTRKAVKQALRIEQPPAVRVLFSVKKRDTKGAPAVRSPESLLWPTLQTVFGLQLSSYRREGGERFDNDVGHVTCTFPDPKSLDGVEVGWKHSLAIAPN